MSPTRINLALQGGGAHGAFTWGVLDRLLDEESIEIEGITATSAGAMNAAVFKAGLIAGGRDGARSALETFWTNLSGLGTLVPEPVRDWFASVAPSLAMVSDLARLNPAYQIGDLWARSFSPYDTNPLNYHPLRSVIDALDFECICADQGPALFIAATNVRTGKVRVFKGNEIDTDAILASACLPTLYQAVEKYDPETQRVEAFWDGGYVGNPALFPLFHNTQSRDILIVNINPLMRPDIPKTAREIENRVNEISFNASLLGELRAIDFVRRLIAEGHMSADEMKSLNIHSIADDETMRQLGVATKLSPTPALLGHLRQAGYSAADTFLQDHGEKIGQDSTCDIRRMLV